MRLTSPGIGVLVLLALASAALAGRDGYSADNLAGYRYNKSLSSRFRLLWDGDDEWLHVAMVAETQGWVAIGIAEPTSGSMPGADMLVGWVDDESGEVVVQDRWAHGKATPSLDDCPSWLSDGGFQNDTHTVVAASRRRDTGDPSDRKIVNGPMKVIWAHNEDGTDGFGYHGSMRHATSIEFFSDPVLDEFYKIDPDWEFVDLKMSNYRVPNRETVYACQSFNLTQPHDKHIVRIEPILDPNTASMVHHFLLHQCELPGVWTNFQTPDKCTSPIAPANTGCMSPIFGWGVGGGPLYLPPEAGYRLGTNANPNKGMRYFILEVHYNSPVPSLPAFRNDSSGVRVYFTSDLRQHDAGMMVLGDPFVTSKPIAPRTSTHIQATCGSQCTSLWDHSINVFADFLHMHSLGARMWSTIHRGNDQIGFLNRIEYYDYNFQELGPLVPYVQLLPGDRIETHCIFNSNSRTANTTFGADSDEEMCMEFIAYYPILKDPDANTVWAVCGYIDREELSGGIYKGNGSACGALDFDTLVPRALGWEYNLRNDLPGGESTSFGIPIDTAGSCPDPVTGIVITPPSPGPKPIDTTLLIWAISIGGFMTIIVLAGLALHIFKSKTSLKPVAIKESSA
jgi:hypothetical protein